MIARGLFSFCPPRSHALSCFPSKSFVSPTCKFSSRNSFVSPTYAKTGGCTPSKMSARRHFLSLLPIHALPLVTPLPAAASAEKGFQSLAHSFIFRITSIPRPSQRLRTLPQKNGGTPHGPATFATFLRSGFLPNGGATHLPPVHRSLAALRNSFPCVSYAKTGG